MIGKRLVIGSIVLGAFIAAALLVVGSPDQARKQSKQRVEGISKQEWERLRKAMEGTIVVEGGKKVSWSEYAKRPSMMLVPPGTTIVFTPSRKINPRPEPFSAGQSRETQRSGHGRWIGRGLVKVSEREIVYKAPAGHGEEDLVQAMKADDGEEFYLEILTTGAGDERTVLVGTHAIPLIEGDDRWWGRGTFQLKVLSSKVPRK